MEVYARLLGTPQLRLAHTSYDPPSTKATTLLYYLAYKGEWCSRDELLYLFYPHTAEEAARSSLRQLLTSIRRSPYSVGLETQATRLRWAVATDVQAFKRAVDERQWLKATKLYQGGLLEGCTLANAPEFESWRALERGEMQELWREAVLNCAEQLQELQRFAEAAELLVRLYKADLLDETVLQRCVTALYRSGERHKALMTYQTFVRTLRQELDGEPDEATLRLIEHVKKGETLGLTAEVEVVRQKAAVKPQRALPLQATPFVGRRAEKTKLAEQLGDPSCRLLTVVGAGGMGKTRLAIEVASVLEDTFADGATFIPLAAVGSHELMVSAVADALDFSFFGPEEPKRQLLAYLRNKEMLLVLDNLEHLLGDISLIVQILETAPGLKLLATSRETLNLHAEWVFDLEGLSYLRKAPPATPPTEAEKQRRVEDYDATHLFVQSARKARPGFVLDETTAPAISHICQLVEGMPLALELAAGWLRVLTPEDIVAELEKGLGLFESSAQDRPSRHQSLRAVFDHSWHLLAEGERQALRKLSVFRGGFTREAADQVADVSLPLLLSLSNKSLLKAGASKRFERHPLMWQYGKEKADAYLDEQAKTRDRHCAYYAAFLHERESWVHGGDRQKKAFYEIENEIDAIRVAWRWAIERRDVSALGLSLESLQQFYYVRGLFHEAEETFRTAAERLGEDSVTLSRLLVTQALFAWEQRHLDAAQAACERSMAMLERLGAPPSARALLHLGIVQVIRGDLEEAQRLHLEGLAVAKASGDLYSMGCNLNMLAQVATEMGDTEEAERYYHESIAAFRQRRDRWGLRMVLTNLGLLLANLGRRETAEACFQESLDFGREIENLPGIADTLLCLGSLSYLQGNYLKAQTYYLESLALWRRLEDVSMVSALTGLGDTAHALHDHRASASYFVEALTTAIRLEDSTGAVASIVGAADLLVSLEEEEKALSLLAFALRRQGIVQDVKDRAARLYAKLRTWLPEEVVAAAQRLGQGLELEDVRKLLVAFVQRSE